LGYPKRPASAACVFEYEHEDEFEDDDPSFWLLDASATLTNLNRWPPNQKTPKMKKLLLMFSLSLVSAALAVEIQQIPSPDNANALLIDKSGRHDVIQLRSGVRVLRLFYDDTDSLKPYIAKSYGVPLSKVGKIGLPAFISAKWLSAAQVEITCNTVAIVGDNESKDFDFTAVVSSTGALESVTITKKAAPTPPKKEKTTPAKKKKSAPRED
jgi:hypothetical protein